MNPKRVATPLRIALHLARFDGWLLEFVRCRIRWIMEAQDKRSRDDDS